MANLDRMNEEDRVALTMAGISKCAEFRSAELVSTARASFRDGLIALEELDSPIVMNGARTSVQKLLRTACDIDDDLERLSQLLHKHFDGRSGGQEV